MISLSGILVDVDASDPHHPALEQAAALARRCGARVKIVDVLPWVPPTARKFVNARMEQELIDHRRLELEAVAAGLEGIPVATELLRGRPATALIQEVLRGRHDLLVRSHDRDLGKPPRPFGAVDMDLLRQCPCPVWLIGHPAPRQGPWRILVTIHANPDDGSEQELNATILGWGLMLKEFGGARLTIMQAWSAYGATLLRSRMNPDEFAAFLDSVRGAAAKALDACIEPYGDRLADVEVELVPGEPEDVIAPYVQSHAIDVVVMGTVARHGIAGLVMGNTAERVLRSLRGSVLAVKPPGFVSAITPE